MVWWPVLGQLTARKTPTSAIEMSLGWQPPFLSVKNTRKNYRSTLTINLAHTQRNKLPKAIHQPSGTYSHKNNGFGRTSGYKTVDPQVDDMFVCMFGFTVAWPIMEKGQGLM